MHAIMINYVVIDFGSSGWVKMGDFVREIILPASPGMAGHRGFVENITDS